MESILFAVLPLVVTGLTSLIKRIPVIDNTNDQGRRNWTIRGIAALLSLGSVVGGYMLSGVAPDPAILSDLVSTLALSFMVFLGSIGGHEVAKAK